ncbi:hypothetical protein SK128_023353 [Halocaridina rubra]|uniref:Uncharacterized protein n=1 Tax=Halocaridina rubra TaxID=373956 RepID=A0AAN8WNA2_HALRR
MARKKQRQQMQRARANKQLLTSIGKRDVQHQLQLLQEEENNSNNNNNNRADGLSINHSQRI